MSWENVVPNVGASTKSVGAVVVTASGPITGRFRPRLSIVVRPALIGEEAAWFVPGARYALELGAGEHAGMVRLRRDGAHVVGSVGKDRLPMVQIIGYDWVSLAPKMSAACDHDSGAGWIEITLPEPIAAAMQTRSASRPAAQVFSTDHVVDPVAARRRGQGPVR